MKLFKLGYLFPFIIFLYGLIGVIRQKIWIHDPGGNGNYSYGVSAVLIGVGFMILGYIIFDIVRNYEKHYESGTIEKFNPFPLRIKIAGSICVLLWIADLTMTILQIIKQ